MICSFSSNSFLYWYHYLSRTKTFRIFPQNSHLHYPNNPKYTYHIHIFKSNQLFLSNQYKMMSNLWMFFLCVCLRAFSIHTTGRVDKLDTSFSRSRSSSMSSLENISTESVTCLAFTDSYTKKSGK